MSLSTHALGRPETTLRSVDGTLVDVYMGYGEAILATPGGKLHFSPDETKALADALSELAYNENPDEAYARGQDDGEEAGYEAAGEDYSAMAFNALNGPNASPEEFVKMLASEEFASLRLRFGGRAA